MKNFIIYNFLGEILRAGFCPDEMVVEQLQPGESAIEGTANDATQYISGGVVTNKPAIGCTIDKTTMLANGIEVATISGLPNHTQARIVGGGTSQQVSVTDGALELTFDLIGVYKITLTAINKLPQEYTINAI